MGADNDDEPEDGDGENVALSTRVPRADMQNKDQKAASM